MQNRIYKTELIEWQKVKDLQPDNLKLPYNYNHIKQSILKHGISKAYDVCELEGELYWIDGHTRTQILMELVSDGVDVPELLTANFCRVRDRKEAIEILLEVHNQRQNPIAEEVLAEWIDVEMVEVAVESLNVKVVEVVEADHETLQAQEDDFDATPPVEPITVLGDLYEIGNHRLLCGDSTDSDQVAKLMNGEKADMVFTDPPYNINVNSITFNTKIKNDNLNEKDFKDFIQSAISNVFLFCKGSKYICFDIREKSFINIFYENGMKSLIVWVKDIGQHHRENYGVKYELIAYFEDGAFYGENEENVWQCKSIQSAGSKDDSGNLWFNGGSKGLTLHPTQKPILIPTRAINNSSKTNELVLDLFLGSGSTMVASHQLKRKCYGMELDPKYCDVIVKRMIKLDPNITVKRNGVDCKKEFM